jgi:hypothetical protein
MLFLILTRDFEIFYYEFRGDCRIKRDAMKKMVLILCALISVLTDQRAAAQTSVVNGGFETGDFTGWTLEGSESPVISTNAHSGSYSADLAVTNVDSSAQKSELDQNTFNAGGGAVNPGDIYNFTFLGK